MRMLICSQEGCKMKATARCRCKDPELLFCADHLGNHLINSPGKHDYEKLFDDPYLQTKNDVLSYIQNELQSLENLKINITKEVYTEMCKIKSSLDVYIGKIDEKIVSFWRNLDEIMWALENSNDSTNLEYLKLPSSEAIAYFKENNKNLIEDSTSESIISEIFKNLGWFRLSEFQEMSSKIKDLDEELLSVKQSCDEKINQNEYEHTKIIESYEMTNTNLKKIYDELYKEKRELELRYNQLIEDHQNCQSQPKRSSIPEPVRLIPSIPGIPQINFFKQSSIESSKVSTVDGRGYTCSLCMGKFRANEIHKNDCGCLNCGNCPFPDFEKIKGMHNRRCRVCNKKKVLFTGSWT
ncbi:unnamed protein product [Blepharisma stoltei]|uniref:Uncharacterized protein n=1 Tax=Blepharisma stoltei TaxID=1481888 RepID=A0AAU9K0D2_9CILI|nr:unnamed protein product [Blepharisma stoltei]